MTYDLLMLMFDDPHAEEVERYLTSKQIKVVREHTVKKAIQCIRYNSYHFVLLDQRLEGADFLMDIVYQGYYGICTYLIAAGEFRHAEERFGARSEYAEVLRMDLTAVPKLVETSEGIFRGKTVVLATGADPRTLGVAGEAELVGRGVAYCAACDGMFYKGKTVVVVGGGRPSSQPRGEKSDPRPPQRRPAGHQDLSRAAGTGRKRGIPLEQHRFRAAFRGQADRRTPAGHRHR